jgi:alkylation response protein AidB-like acyl-CoA dehydrogenase
MPNVTEWDEAKQVPDEIYREMGERGYLAGLLGIHYPAHLTQTRVKSVPPEKWDHFHEMILTDELSRTGSGGLVWNLIGGYGIGPGLLSGEKRICLAITEPGKSALHTHSSLG